MISFSPKKVLRKIVRSLYLNNNNTSRREYWENRSRRYGIRSVFNLGHAEDELDSVTQKQKEVIYPLFLKSLRGYERIVLDFGCGPGRFTTDLATMIGGKAIGIDPIWCLLDMASKADNVEYILSDGGMIPLKNASIDVVWVCLVLGGIKGDSLKKNIREINRVLKPGSLLFLIENTSRKMNGEHWTFRSVDVYRVLFSDMNLISIGEYFDVDERISIMAGRKPLQKAKTNRYE